MAKERAGSFGALLQHYRLAAGLTQAALANLTRLSAHHQ